MVSVCTVRRSGARAAAAAWGDERCLLSDLSDRHETAFLPAANPVNGQLSTAPAAVSLL